MNITGIASYLPSRIADNEYFSRITGRSPDWFLERTGIHQRRRAAEGENTNTLGVRAVRSLAEIQQEQLDETDLIIGCSYTPWDTVGTLAHVVQREFNLSGARAFYMSSACASVINAMEIAAAMFQSLRSKRILIVAAEHNSLYSRDDDSLSGHLWGDGGAAMLLSTQDEGDYEVIDVQTRGCGHVGKGPGGVFLTPRQDGLVMPFGKDVFTQACREMAMSARDILTRNGLCPDDVHLLVPHQANRRIIDHVGRELGITCDRVASTVERFGNTGCASTLITLHEQSAQLVRNDLVLLTVFGGGYSAGAALLRRR